LIQWLHSLLPHLPHYGYALVFVIVFLNNIGIPLPGDSTLLGAGFILGKNGFSLWQPILAGILACFLGGVWSFWMGRLLGHSGFNKISWFHLTAERIQWVENYFKKQGPKAVFLGRFIFLFPPIAVNLLAGIAKMSWTVFLFYNLTGSVIYASSYILAGYLFGSKWKLLEAWLGPMALFLILVALTIIGLGVFFRQFLFEQFQRIFLKKKTVHKKA
jgi:membrane protein DedA with SNARE-associated domain